MNYMKKQWISSGIRQGKEQEANNALKQDWTMNELYEKQWISSGIRQGKEQEANILICFWNV